MFTHPDEQQCFEWVPTITGQHAWNQDSLNAQMCELKTLQDPDKIVQGPASTMSMGLIYTCNKMKCIVHCPCSLCNEEKTCALLCRDIFCEKCSSQCLNHQINLPRLFNSETNLYTLVLDSELNPDHFRVFPSIPYAGIPASCSDCEKDVLEHQIFHMVFHTRCRYCRNDLRPFVQRQNIVNIIDHDDSEKLLNFTDERTCSFCLVMCQNKYERKKHGTTVHENKGKYVCEICGKTYSNKNALSYHSKHSDGVKTAKKPVCDLCHSEFTTETSLQRHIKTVHQEPNVKSKYECECGDKFSLKSNLNVHKKEQHLKINANLDYVEDFEAFVLNQCDQCTKSFKRKYQLKRHINTVHCDTELKKQFECTQCESKFSRPDALKRHMNQKHPE